MHPGFIHWLRRFAASWIWLILAALHCQIHAAPSLPEWQPGPGFRKRPLTLPNPGHSGFTLLPPDITGVQFTNLLTDDQAALNQILINGSGVAAGDVDGDGWCDLYFCRLGGPNALYRNLGGRRFEEVAESSGVACNGLKSTGSVFADIDGDGDLDLLVNTLGGGTHVFFNDGHGHFKESSQVLNLQRAGMSLTLADIDGDGDLDLYIANYRSTTVRSTGLQMLLVNGKKTLRPEDRDGMFITPDGMLREYGEVDVLFLNDGHGGFTPQSWTDGRFLDETGRPLTTPPRDWGQSAMFHDLNGDGFPDLYVCNDFWTPDRIWINDGKGTFRAIAPHALPATPTFSMGIDIADLNRDGIDDVLVLDMLGSTRQQRIRHAYHVGGDGPYAGIGFERPQIERNTLFVGRGDGTFSEIAQYAGLDATDWSWCPIFLDVDLDGFEDVIIGTGNLFDTQNDDADIRIRAKGRWPKERIPYKLLEYPRLPQPTHAYRNHGDLTFEDRSTQWGLDAIGVSHGMCLADLDNDGALEVIANVMNGPARIFWNETAAPRVAVRLRGPPPNTHGIGAKIRLLGGPVPMQSQEMISGGRYLSGDDPERVFAAGLRTNQLTIEVDWRSGKKSQITNVTANCLYEIDEPADSTTSPSSKNLQKRLAKPYFEDVSRLLNHEHRENLVDEFHLQPLLPRRMGQLGPGVAWFDLDGDGWDDLIVGGGRGQAATVFHNQNGQKFERVKPTVLMDVPEASPVVIGLATNRLLVGQGSSGSDGVPRSHIEDVNIQNGTKASNAPVMPGVLGPVCLADFDGDGVLDMFVGGRYQPGRYPESIPSHLYRGTSAGWALAREFTDLGMVTGAIWSDLDSDGWPDLILAIEWGPIRVFHNDHGLFREITRELGLEAVTGWWSGIAVGDFDEDGRLDLVAGNWGLNSPYKASPLQPLHLFYGDFFGSGGIDILEAEWLPGTTTEVPRRDRAALLETWPILRDLWRNNADFTGATIASLFGSTPPKMQRLEATSLASTVFLNRGTHFDPRPLPMEAQWSPANGIAVADLDGDGYEDVFLSQNVFGVNNSVSLLNSGVGLWLRGDGRGGFAPVSPEESGIVCHGEQRGVAVADYDQDGRIDLVVGQNSAPTCLYHSLKAKPGIRVRLKGTAGNPQAIGAQLRWKTPSANNPVHEIHAGGGYLSQDSAIQIMPEPQYPATLEILWPGGKKVSTVLTGPAHEIEIDPNGTLTTVR